MWHQNEDIRNVYKMNIISPLQCKVCKSILHVHYYLLPVHDAEVGPSVVAVGAGSCGQVEPFHHVHYPTGWRRDKKRWENEPTILQRGSRINRILI